MLTSALITCQKLGALEFSGPVFITTSLIVRLPMTPGVLLFGLPQHRNNKGTIVMVGGNVAMFSLRVETFTRPWNVGQIDAAEIR